MNYMNLMRCYGGINKMTIGDANDLKLYIDNDYPLHKSMYEPIINNLCKHKRRGKYDSDKAVTAFLYLTRAGAKKYAAEFPGTHITAAAKLEAATDMRDEFEIEYDLGNYGEERS